MGWSANDLAWFLATESDKTRRNGKAAVVLAVEACETTNWQYWGFIDTLAAALAESGEFEEAVRLALVSRALAPDSEHKTIDGLITRYKNNQSYPD